jgi:hypothetical protein
MKSLDDPGLIDGFGSLIALCRRRGPEVYCGTFLFSLLDLIHDHTVWQSFGGGPVWSLPWDGVAVMLYGSYLRGMGTRLFPNWERAHRLLLDLAETAAKKSSSKIHWFLGLYDPADAQGYRSYRQLRPLVQGLRKLPGTASLGLYDAKGFPGAIPPEGFAKSFRYPVGLDDRSVDRRFYFRNLLVLGLFALGGILLRLLLGVKKLRRLFGL